MPLKSMTGFARSEGTYTGTRWHWEVRSVNGRGLDVRVRLAPGFEALEIRTREAVSHRMARGNVSINLAVQRDAGDGDMQVNEAALQRVLALVARLRASGDFDRPRPETLLSLRGILEPVTSTETDTEAAERSSRMLSSLDAALDGLVAARAEEGARLEPLLEQQFKTIEALVAEIVASPSRTPVAIQARLRDQLQRLALTGSSGIDETRLYQEAALLAARADIEEEVARLAAHVGAGRDLLAAREPVGRRLDFLTQEFNREANTLCSKSNDIDITRAGLALKAIIDQMREQVQNIE